MEISIQELDESNLGDINRCDGIFTVDSRLCLQLKNGQITYSIENVPPYKKRYAVDEVDYSSYLHQAGRNAYLAYVDGNIAGQIIIRENWNKYCYIEDIAVDIQYRQQGIGRSLLTYAIGWARAKNLPGIMLETQDNNVAACRFYERCGFQLGGFDQYLYRALHVDTDEIALYWYLIFK
jgi:streptothricin acetyltransferase